jgi:carboxypeptidase family protein
MFRNRLSGFFLCVFVLGFVLLGFVQRADAQVLFGSVSGTVTDQSGAGVPKARITLVSKATSVQKEADADESGHYTITDVPPGNYDLTVKVSGFKPLTQTNLTVAANVVTNGDARLQVGAVSDQVIVEAAAVSLQTEKTDLHTELTEKAILDMPLNQYRNYQTLINLVPGATPGVFQNAIADTPERALSTNINGTNRNNNNTRVDGATDVFVWLPHHTVYVPPAETIQEVNISTNNFDPEQGMTGGAAITVITKSGSNQFHGALFEYHEDQALRARQFFETPASSPRKGKSILNDLGGTLGGPIRKDKLFFFGSYDGTFERDNRQVSTGPSPGIQTVPTAALRVGDFSAIATKVYDPSTGGGNPAARSQFIASSNPSSPNFNAACTNVAGCPNMIPTARLSSISKQILALVPQPNLPGDTANFFSSATQRLTRHNFDGKVDWNRTSKHSIFAKYSAMRSVFHGVPNLGKAIGDCACDGGLGDFHSLVQLVTAGHTLTLSPTLVVDGNVGFTRMSEYGQTPDFGTNIGSAVLGIPGTNGPDLRSSGFPLFAISGYANIGNPEGWNPAFRNDWSFTSNHNVRWSHGKHQISAGTDIVHHHLNHWQPELGAGPRGEFDFGGGPTALRGGAAPDRFNALAEFELGLFGELNSQAGSNIGAGRSDQFIKATAREWQFGWFIGDRYRITNKFTVNLGLRYEYYPLMKRNGAFTFDRYDFATNQVLLGGIGGNSENLGVTTSKKLFAPRIGFAYQVNDKTVVRSGFGITVDPLPLARPLRGFYPLTVGAAFAGLDGFTPYSSLSNGIPIICCSNINISSGSISLPTAALERSTGTGLLKRGYIESWNLTVERKLPANFIVSAAYVGTQTVHQFADLNVNASLPGTGQAGQPLNIRFGRTTETDLWQGYLSANYHALQTSINRQFSHGLMIKGAYTYSRAIDYTDDDGWASVVWNDPSIFKRNRAPAGFNTPHIFQVAYIYELPVGRGKQWASSGGVATKVLSDWQVSGIFSAIHGQPFSLTASAASLNAVGQRQTPNQVGPVRKLGGVGTGQPFYDPTAFAPVTASAAYGNVGRNTLYGPGSVNMDFSLFRTFHITERLNLQFRTDAANLFNAPHFNNPTGSRSSGNFLVITGAKNDERQFRFGLRLAF